MHSRKMVRIIALPLPGVVDSLIVVFCVAV